jgi:hypothetical protein
MLEMMRDYTLQVQAMNEGKKLHQFKAYETMNPHFVKAYLSTYPNEMKVQHLAESADKLKELFKDTVKQSSFFSISEDLLQPLKLAEHTEA